MTYLKIYTPKKGPDKGPKKGKKWDRTEKNVLELPFGIISHVMLPSWARRPHRSLGVCLAHLDHKATSERPQTGLRRRHRPFDSSSVLETTAAAATPPEFLALKHESRILGQGSNPVQRCTKRWTCLLSNSQAGPGRCFTQPRAYLIVKFCMWFLHDETG